MNTPEGRVKSSIKGALKSNSVYYFMPMQNGFGVVGVPDIIACVPTIITEEMVGKVLGVFMGIEAKAVGKLKNTTPNQRKQLTKIHEAGGIAIVTDNSTDVLVALSNLRAEGMTDFKIPM